MTGQHIQTTMQQDDDAMDDLNHAEAEDFSDLQNTANGFDDDMLHQQQGEDEEEEPYNVTEQGGSDGEGDGDGHH